MERGVEAPVGVVTAEDEVVDPGAGDDDLAVRLEDDGGRGVGATEVRGQSPVPVEGHVQATVAVVAGNRDAIPERAEDAPRSHDLAVGLDSEVGHASSATEPHQESVLVEARIEAPVALYRARLAAEATGRSAAGDDDLAVALNRNRSGALRSRSKVGCHLPVAVETGVERAVSVVAGRAESEAAADGDDQLAVASSTPAPVTPASRLLKTLPFVPKLGSRSPGAA